MTVRLERIVVVGNGIAGLTASDSLRAAGFDGQLTIVGDEHHAPYSRPALSKAALLDAEEMTSHQLPPSTHEARELLGRRALQLDPDLKTVVLDDGSILPYDGLVIASGSRARRLSSADPAARRHELTLRTLEDALELRRRIANKPSVVVVGGGALGMEIASGCLAAGCEVTLASHHQPMAQQLGPHLSEVFLAAGLSQGLKFAPARAVGLREADGHPLVELADGSTLATDLVVSAIGDIPNTGWLTDSGLLTGGRLEVDSRGRLRPDIVAAGDVAAFPTARGIARIPLWTSAIEQSKAAALALLNGDDAPELDFRPYFWTEQFGLSLKASGHLPLDGAPEFLEGGPDGGPALMRWTHRDGSGTAVALNYRIPIPKLRRLANPTPALVESPA
ncbi:NAD(P)/FAD-dependent oxidoreductase [Arthrobacter sulfonylureivorans]|uniref:FAD-dependent oxidoreductase n=1 Tax=Arthrobacter sulfonylureivorans TaxID=2486855 RepID=A0ABY3W909_9MICC|nr:FAD-dependent oxidoreductase [Arthrobacter sulfonylureivorans]UNK45618.1 FAD-dependent oxidoreductase [Arthrobacter sulfonylureivorans]